MRGALLAVILCAVALAGRAPDLRGIHAYTGTYVRDGGSQPFGFEVERQKGRSLLEVAIDASNEAQFHGTGTISKDLSHFKVKTHTLGAKRFRHRLQLDGAIVGNGQALEGTYVLLRPNLAPMTGTFSVAR